MTCLPVSATRAPDAFLPRYLPLALITGLGLSAMGAPLSTLPRYVHDHLGFGTLIVGLMIGLESAVTLLTRGVCGRLSDRRGPKFGMMLGLVFAALSGVAYLLPLIAPVRPLTALAFIAAARIAMGVAESLIFITAETWPLATIGVEDGSRIVSWNGLAMFGGITIGTGLCAMLTEQFGLFAAATSIVVLPLVGLAIAATQPDARSPSGTTSLTFARALRRIWRACACMGLGTVGYAAANAFLVLTFDTSQWGGGGLAVTLVGVGFVAARLAFANRMDRLDGVRAMRLTLATEVAGLLLVALAPAPWLALVGAILIGFGYSLLFPLLAVPIIRRTPAGGLGMTMGAFTASIDLALGVVPPLCALLAVAAGFQAVFLCAALAVVSALWPAAAQRRALSRGVSS